VTTRWVTQQSHDWYYFNLKTDSFIHNIGMMLAKDVRASLSG